MSIFVHMISYRDPELVPSIRDCIANAARPDELIFGIVWQHTEDDRSMEPFLNNPQFRILDIPAAEAKGCCWARAKAQSLYRGEDFVLQLDSHHRFEPGWDTTLIDMMRQTGAKKPAITSYASGYDSENGKHTAVPLVIRLRPFSPDGSLMFYGSNVAGWEQRETPYKARMASGHFFFTLGQHCLEVPYDPDLYFLGEELVMMARSFTHGYDMFHPHRVVVWHQYERKGRSKIWDDSPKIHNERDKISKERVLKLMGMEDNNHEIGIYGLGTVRTLREFEDYVGIDFARRLIHQDAMDGSEPPTEIENDRMASVRTVLLQWKQELELPDDTTSIIYRIEAPSKKVLWQKEITEKPFLPPAHADVCDLQEPSCFTIWPKKRNGEMSNVRYVVPLRSANVYLST